MAQTTAPTYVVAGKNGYLLQFFADHPPFCVCDGPCADPVRRPPTMLDRPFPVRVQRKSPHPMSKKMSTAAAINLKREIEEQLCAAVVAAAARNAAMHAPTLQRIADDYIAYQTDEKKRLDRDQYVIEEIVAHFGADRDPTTITKADYRDWCAAQAKRGLAKSTIARRTTTLLAILNRARRWDVIPRHQLDGIEKPKPMIGRPVILTPLQRNAVFGRAMDAYEAEQAEHRAAHDPTTHRIPPSVVPLRGIALIAFCTLLRPTTNLGLRWEDVTLHATKDEGSFHVARHKNADKGIRAAGALHPDLVRYLRGIRPAKARGLIHPNPATGRAFVNIRAQWARLIAIANTLLPDDEQIQGRAEDFYVLRATGASVLAAAGADPVLICSLMGDAQLETVRKHYFSTDLSRMQSAVNSVLLPGSMP